MVTYRGALIALVEKEGSGRNFKTNLKRNYCKITLTKPMETLLNRGLNFCVTPDKVNVVQIEVDLNKFFFVEAFIVYPLNHL